MTSSTSGLDQLPDTDQPELLAEAIRQALRRKPVDGGPIANGRISSRKLRQLQKTLADHEGYSHQEVEQRKIAYQELGLSRDPQVVSTLIAGLSDEQPSVREVVIGALGELPGTEAFTLILPNLTDPDPTLQRATLHSLRKLADLRAIRPLLAVAMRHSTLRHLALDVVVKYGIAAVPELLKLVRDKELGFAHLSIVALGRIGHADAVPDLLTVMNQNGSPVVRAAVVEALGLIADKRAVPTLIESLKDPSAAVRAKSAAAFLRMPDTRAVRPLIHAIKDEDREVRRFATLALGEIGNRQALPYFSQLLRGWEELAQVDAPFVAVVAEAVGKIGDSSISPMLLPLLESSDETILTKALVALRRLKAPEAGPALNRRLQDPRPTIRRLAVEILGRSGDAAALAPLTEILRNDPSHELRAIAARSLGELKIPEAAFSLEEALRDETVVRLQAVIALGRIQNKHTLPGLMAMLRDSTPEVRYQAVLSIARFGDPKTVKAISVLVTDEDPMVRQGAIAALEQLGHRGVDQADKLVRSARWRDRALRMVPRAVWVFIPGRRTTAIVAATLIGLFAGGFFLASSTGNQPVVVVRRGGVSELRFSGDGDQLAVGRSAGLLELWNVPQKELLRTASGGKAPAFTQDNQSVLLIVDEHLVRWNPDSGDDPSGENPLEDSAIRHWVVTPDARWGVSVSSSGDVARWDLRSVQKDHSFRLGTDNAVSVTVSPDGLFLAGSNMAGEVSLFDLTSGKLVQRLKAKNREPLSHMSISSDRHWIAAVTKSSNAVLVWQMDEPSETKVLDARELVARGLFSAIGLTFLPDNQRLLVATIGPVNVISLETGDTTVIPHDLNKVDAFALSESGKQLALGNREDSQVVLIDLERSAVIAELDAP